MNSSDPSQERNDQPDSSSPTDEPTQPADEATDAPQDQPHQEPSLGPACLVVAILSLAVMSAFCAFSAWFMFRDQYPLAVDAINKQLIPWIESCQLAPEDKRQIIAELNDLVPPLENRTLSKRQLTRLRNCLQDNPVPLWGGVQSIIAQAPDSGLTETELQTLQRVSERLLRAAAERKLSRNDLEFTIQNCSRVRQDGQSLEVVDNLTAEQIREYMTRAEQLVEENGIPNEPYEKTPAEAFGILIDAALQVE